MGVAVGQWDIPHGQSEVLFCHPDAETIRLRMAFNLMCVMVAGLLYLILDAVLGLRQGEEIAVSTLVLFSLSDLAGLIRGRSLFQSVIDWIQSGRSGGGGPSV